MRGVYARARRREGLGAPRQTCSARSTTASTSIGYVYLLWMSTLASCVNPTSCPFLLRRDLRFGPASNAADFSPNLGRPLERPRRARRGAGRAGLSLKPPRFPDMTPMQRRRHRGGGLRAGREVHPSSVPASKGAVAAQAAVSPVPIHPVVPLPLARCSRPRRIAGAVWTRFKSSAQGLRIVAAFPSRRGALLGLTGL